MAILTGQEWAEQQEEDTGQVYVELFWGQSKEAFAAKEFSSCGVAEAAERAVAAHLGDMDGLPDEVPHAKVYWPSGVWFGPFPVDISISIEATCLRGGP